MNHLKLLWKKPLPTPRNSLVIFVFVVALLGFIDATYLSIEHYRGVIPPCTIVSGCETVLTGPYSAIFGIPVALLGAIFYLVILVGAFSFLESKKTTLFKWSLLFTLFGFIFSLWFTYAQAFVIGSWCLYCLGSALTSTILFVTAWIVFKKSNFFVGGQDLSRDSYESDRPTGQSL